MQGTSLSADDVQAVMVVVGDVLEAWADPAAWRAALLAGACRLTGAAVGTLTGQVLRDDGQVFGAPIPLAVHGMSATGRETFAAAIERTNHREVAAVAADAMPGAARLFGTFAAQGWATFARADLADDAAYYASPHHAFRRQADCDDYVISVRAVDVPHHIEVLTTDRLTAAPRFAPRDVAVVQLLHDEIAPLVGVRLATEAHFSADGLSNRLRDTLRLLLAGRSEKQMAADLGLSPLTVHEYVGRLFRHFGVAGRPQLMAYFVRRIPLAKP